MSIQEGRRLLFAADRLRAGIDGEAIAWALYIAHGVSLPTARRDVRRAREATAPTAREVLAAQTGGAA